MSYQFFQNKKCEWFPCHNINNIDKFNCMFCFCPLYEKDCDGNYRILDNGIKDCSHCLIPHTNYKYVIDKIIEYNKEKSNR